MNVDSGVASLTNDASIVRRYDDARRGIYLSISANAADARRDTTTPARPAPGRRAPDGAQSVPSAMGRSVHRYSSLSYQRILVTL